MIVLAVVLSAGALAACGEEETASEPAGASAEEPVRLGCGTYCQQAGGYGGGSTAKPMVAFDTADSLEVLPDGTVPVTLTCRFSTPCEGALLIFSEDVGEYGGDAGRSDLAVDAGTTRTLAVALSDRFRALLDERGELEVVVHADVGPSLETLPMSEQDEWNANVAKVRAISAAGP